MITLIKTYFTNWLEFNSKTTRKDCWTTIGIVSVTSVGLFMIAMILEPIMHEEGMAMMVRQIITFVVLMPTISLFCRRLNDTGFPLWITVLILFPYAGFLLLLVTLLPKDAYYAIFKKGIK